MEQHAAATDRWRWLVLAVLCLSLSMVVIDNTVLNVAVPSLISDLGADIADVQWVLNSYLLVLAGLLLVAGGASDRYGRKRVLLIGLIVFGGASLAASFADSPGQLIAARAVMGVGAACLMPGTLSVLMHTFNEQERPKAIGIWMAVSSVGIAGGPVLGGFLIDRFWWGAVFLVNVPLALISVIAVIVLVPESRVRGTGRLDLPGAVLSIATGVSIVWAIIAVPEKGWTSSRVLTWAALGLVMLVVFVLWERRFPEPMFDLTLFRNARFSAAVSGGLLAGFGMAGSMFLLTQHFQMLLNYSPLEAGLRMMPLALSLLIGSSMLSAPLGKRLGAPAALLGAMTVAAAGLALISFLGSGGYAGILAGLVLLGLGIGVAGPVAGNALMSAIPLERAGMGAGVNSTVQELGNALGVAALGSILAALFRDRLPIRVEGEGSLSLPDVLSQLPPGDLALVDRVRDAFGDGLSNSQILGAAVVLAGGLIASFLLWRTKPLAQQPPTPQAQPSMAAEQSDLQT
ncbi:MFS transporter [Actinomadura rubrobrunea]|uniref:MFS transporter n=1 Tax=Actinomadura rubrobrunea TaxID=115335 RepID=A0A9W6UVK8_9ACTN|nr:MFS transporter [Actinomadura rubrobrunea]GLW65164.1 MFS transporter [Actinomadura rubrobrunea]